MARSRTAARACVGSPERLHVARSYRSGKRRTANPFVRQLGRAGVVPPEAAVTFGPDRIEAFAAAAPPAVEAGGANEGCRRGQVQRSCGRRPDTGVGSQGRCEGPGAPEHSRVCLHGQAGLHGPQGLPGRGLFIGYLPAAKRRERRGLKFLGRPVRERDYCSCSLSPMAFEPPILL